MLTKAKSAHLGCCLSIVDILVVLYHAVLDVESIRQQKPERDYFILSKGHAAAALYVTLASVGLIKRSALEQYHQNGTSLAGHPVRDTTCGLEATTGSLGHGLSMGVGLALAALHNKTSSQIYVLVGDGECQEGSIWEAIAMASRFKLTNLTLIVDYNRLQGLDCSDNIMGDLANKFQGFGFYVIETDGHNHTALLQAFVQRSTIARPCVIIAHTTKGKGVCCIENKLEWHYRTLKPDQYLQARQEVDHQ